MVVAMRIEAKDATEMVRNISKNLPKAINKGMEELADLAVTNLKTQAHNVGIDHWGGGRERSIFRGGTHKRKTKDGYIIVMSKHGVFLDSMRPHWVALKRGRDITKWALSKGLAVSVGRGFRPVATTAPGLGLTKIYVRPHPFIQTAFLKTVKGIKIVKRRVKKNIRSKGRVI